MSVFFAPHDFNYLIETHSNTQSGSIQVEFEIQQHTARIKINRRIINHLSIILFNILLFHLFNVLNVASGHPHKIYIYNTLSTLLFMCRKQKIKLFSNQIA